MDNENKKNSKNTQSSSVMDILKYAGTAKKEYIISVICNVIGVLCGMFPYFSAGYIISAFYNKEATTSIVLGYGLLALVAVIIKGLLTTLATKKAHGAAFTIIKNIRIALIQKMRRVPLGVINNNSSGKLKTLIVDTADKIEKPLAHILPEMIANILVAVFLVIILFAINWKIALACLAAVPIGFIIYLGQTIGYEKKSKLYNEANENMNNAIIEYVEGIEVIKTFNQSGKSYGKYTKAVERFRDVTLSWWRGCWFFTSVGGAIMTSTLLVALPVGGFMFMHGNVEFTDFILSLTLSLGIAGPIMGAAEYVEDFAVVDSSLKKINEFMAIPELVRPEKRVELKNYQFKFNNVKFAYDKKEILHGINFETVSSGVTAIVGPSGGGKSTIAKLMAGFWDPSDGVVTFGGVNTKDIPMEELVENISVVFQDNFLFDKSVFENIRLGNLNATDEEVIEAAKMSGCHEFIEKLENGYNTIVGDSGGKLSGGERQRITIARAMLKKSNVVILDEATAYADPENEAIIEESINNLVKGKNLIVIAHRLSTIKNADKILVVQNGNIVSEGTHDELLVKSELYKDMWEKHISANI